MQKRLKNRLLGVSLDSNSGRFLGDKSFKYDVVFFMANYICENSVNGSFNREGNKNKIISYTIEKFNLNPKSDGIANFMAETINLLEYAGIISNVGYGYYEIVDNEILHFICERMENAYIFQYMVAYYTFYNDGLLSFYSLFVNSEDESYRINMIKTIYSKICNISPSIQEDNTVWSKLYTKYPLMVLGFANGEKEISRTLHISKDAISAFSLSANVNGTRTKPEYKKINNYSGSFDIQYVREFLKMYLIKG